MSQLSDQYVQRLDLAADPFASDFSGHYFYAGASRRQLLDQIVHLSRFGDHSVIIVGSVGSGTSTLLDKCIEKLQPLMGCFCIDAESDSSPTALLNSLSEQFGLRLASPIVIDDFLLALENYCSYGAESEPILLAIDQAHFLELEGYQCLLDIVQRALGSVCLLFAGEYQVEQLAQLAGFVNTRIKVFELEALTLSETDDYLMGLLRSVGYAGAQPLSSDQLTVLHERAGGNIADINSLVPSLLSGDGHTEKKSVGLVIPVTHLVAIAVLVVALLLSYFYQGSPEHIDDKVSNHNQGKEVLQSPKQLVSTPQSTVPMDLDKAQNPSADKKMLHKSTSQITEPEALLKPLATSEENADGLDAEVTTEIINNSSIAKATGNTATVKNSETFKAEKTDSVQAVSNIEPSKSSIIGSKGSVAKRSEAKPVVITKPQPIKKPKPSVIVTSTVTPREQRLMRLPASSYMLQLLGAVEEKRSREFVKRYIGRLDVTYVEIRRNGKPWFVVLSGPYANREEAVAAIKGLPGALQRQKPWARSVASIQQSINKK